MKHVVAGTARTVASRPPRGAWIETQRLVLRWHGASVAPARGRGVNRAGPARGPRGTRSPPARGRGLKHLMFDFYQLFHMSPPARGRGLKPLLRLADEVWV